jgi:hypothetical protein
MEAEIKVRKPSKLRILAKKILGNYALYYTKEFEWQMKLPKNGDQIKITWFPDNRGATNAYIGMSGVVENMNINDGHFILNCGNCILICSGDFNYIRL